MMLFRNLHAPALAALVLAGPLRAQDPTEVVFYNFTGVPVQIQAELEGEDRETWLSTPHWDDARNRWRIYEDVDEFRPVWDAPAPLPDGAGVSFAHDFQDEVTGVYRRHFRVLADGGKTVREYLYWATRSFPDRHGVHQEEGRIGLLSGPGDGGGTLGVRPAGSRALHGLYTIAPFRNRPYLLWPAAPAARTAAGPGAGHETKLVARLGANVKTKVQAKLEAKVETKEPAPEDLAPEPGTPAFGLVGAGLDLRLPPPVDILTFDFFELDGQEDSRGPDPS